MFTLSQKIICSFSSVRSMKTFIFKSDHFMTELVLKCLRNKNKKSCFKQFNLYSISAFRALFMMLKFSLIQVLS